MKAPHNALENPHHLGEETWQALTESPLLAI